MLLHLVSSRFFCSKALKKRSRNLHQNHIKSMKKRVPNWAPKKIPKSDPKRDPKWEPFEPKRPSSRLPEPSGMPAAPPRTPPEVLRGFQEHPGTLQGSILTTPGTIWRSIWTSQGSPGHLKIQRHQEPRGPARWVGGTRERGYN